MKNCAMCGFIELKNIIAVILIIIFAIIITYPESKAEMRSEPINYTSEPIKAVLTYQRALRNRDYKTLWNSMTTLHQRFFDNKYENYAKIVFKNTTVGQLLGKGHLKEIKYISDYRIWIELEKKDDDKIRKAALRIFNTDSFRGFPYLIKENGEWKFAHTARYFYKARSDMQSLTIAIEDFYKSNHRLPQQLSDLIHPTKYISDMPVDVFNDAGTPYVYKVINEKSWMIYSFGPDSDDDLGLVEYNPHNGEISNGDIIFMSTIYSMSGKISSIDYSSEPIKAVFAYQKALRNRRYRILWDLITEVYRAIFNEDYREFKKWHLWRYKNEPKIDDIFANSDIKEIKYINNNRAWVEFYVSYPEIQKNDFTTKGLYLVKENNNCKFGSIAKYIKIKLKTDVEVLANSISNFYKSNHRLPQQLSDLIHPTKYISDMPVDVFNDAGTPYVYKVINEKSWMIYSFGPDSDDDLGLVEYDIINHPISNGDIIFIFSI